MLLTSAKTTDGQGNIWNGLFNRNHFSKWEYAPLTKYPIYNNLAKTVRLLHVPRNSHHNRHSCCFNSPHTGQIDKYFPLRHKHGYRQFCITAEQEWRGPPYLIASITKVGVAKGINQPNCLSFSYFEKKPIRPISKAWLK